MKMMKLYITHRKLTQNMYNTCNINTLQPSMYIFQSYTISFRTIFLVDQIANLFLLCEYQLPTQVNEIQVICKILGFCNIFAR